MTALASVVEMRSGIALFMLLTWYIFYLSCTISPREVYAFLSLLFVLNRSLEFNFKALALAACSLAKLARYQAANHSGIQLQRSCARLARRDVFLPVASKRLASILTFDCNPNERNYLGAPNEQALMSSKHL